MQNKFRIALVLLALSLLSLAFADNPAGMMNLEYFDIPSATADDMFSPLINPSLLGTGKPGGLGWAHLNNEEKWQDHYWFFANMEGISYVYEHNEGVDHHTFASGTEFFPRHILPNLYVGSSYGWTNNKTGKGNFRSAVTYRPHDAASLAFRWDNPYKDRPAYHAGLALRPLAFAGMKKDYALELSGDLDYAFDGTDYKAFKPSFGINTQVLDGLLIGASYNLETESAMLNFSLRSRSNELGTRYRLKENDNYGVGYLHLSENNFKPLFGIKSKSWYDMKLKGEVVTYKAAKYKLGPLSVFDGNQLEIEQVIKDLKTAAADPRVSGISLINPSFSASFALQQELLSAFSEFRKSGKKVIAYYDNISNGGYIFAAAAADKIYLNPQGSLDLKGISVNSPYLKGLLDAVGIEVLNFRSHPFKTAGNQLSETEMTASEREMYDSLLGSIYEQMLAQIETGRDSKLTKSAAQTIDEGPYYLASDALAAGLVDGIIYQDELAKIMKDEFKFSNRISAATEYMDYSWALPKEKKIAVIYAQGNIVMGSGEPGQKIAHDTTVNLIRKARKDKSYKGIILRVDSGGGSAQASDIILRELSLAQTENKLPVVVSMAGVAGSGGYYIACQADRIIADPATLTGSIGVIGLTFNAENAFKKVKVNWSTVNKGKRADFGSMYRPWREDEKQLMTNLIENTYNDFVGKVDKGRKSMDLDAVKRNAQGRVWTGAQALEIGLVDALGGLDVASAQMRELTGIKGEMKLVDATSSDSGFQVNMKSNPLLGMLPLGALEAISEDYVRLFELWEDFGSENVLMYSPYSSEIISFE